MHMEMQYLHSKVVQLTEFKFDLKTRGTIDIPLRLRIASHSCVTSQAALCKMALIPIGCVDKPESPGGRIKLVPRTPFSTCHGTIQTLVSSTKSPLHRHVLHLG